MNKDEIFDQLSDDFKTTSLSNSTLIDMGNTIIRMSFKEKDPIVLEAMFHAIVSLIETHDIAKYLIMDSVIDNIGYYNEQCIEYILCILSYTGNEENINIIYNINNMYPHLDVQDYIDELKSRIDL